MLLVDNRLAGEAVARSTTVTPTDQTINLLGNKLTSASLLEVEIYLYQRPLRNISEKLTQNSATTSAKKITSWQSLCKLWFVSSTARINVQINNQL